ncbi:hypothetical protein AAE478_002231 [Parahypoxylon ruwenzoriense]
MDGSGNARSEADNKHEKVEDQMNGPVGSTEGGVGVSDRWEWDQWVPLDDDTQDNNGGHLRDEGGDTVPGPEEENQEQYAREYRLCNPDQNDALEFAIMCIVSVFNGEDEEFPEHCRCEFRFRNTPRRRGWEFVLGPPGMRCKCTRRPIQATAEAASEGASENFAFQAPS